ncbi:DUF4394 domain-containing protein, partial [bacterium]|nr:DUF4394 domain-containing protein [bacterium]
MIPFFVRYRTAPSLLLLVTVLLPGYGAAAYAGQSLYAVTADNRLLQFDSSNPCAILSDQLITGLQVDEAIVGIDFRPANGQLYGLGSRNRLYTISTSTAVATVGADPFVIPIQGKAAGFDFNPTVDRVRIITNTGQNLRVNPVTGAIVGFDTNLAYAVNDANEGVQPQAVGAAYTNPDNDPLTGTTLYDIDSRLEILTTQNPPNSGTLNTTGLLGATTSVLEGFDIAPSGIAYAALKVNKNFSSRECGGSQLVTVNLINGTATSL